MASTPKIKISIPASLQLTDAEAAKLKSAFQADVIRVVKRLSGGVRNDIINISLPAHSSKKKTSKKKAAKKAGKKK